MLFLYLKFQNKTYCSFYISYKIETDKQFYPDGGLRRSNFTLYINKYVISISAAYLFKVTLNYVEILAPNRN